MAKLDPFHALRPTLARAREVAAVPYDVVDRSEAKGLAVQQGPLSFLHVSRAEIDLPDSTSAYAPEVYTQAQHAFSKLIASAPLLRDTEACIYIYRLEVGAHQQTGVAGLFSIAEYRSGVIRKHERTRPEKEDDRTRHLLALAAQTGPSYLAHRPRASLRALTTQITQGIAAADFVADDGVRHVIWACPPGDLQRKILAEFAAMDRLYIADGHHRAASAARAQDERGGPGSEGGVLAVAFPADELQILPYHRVVRDLGMELPEFWKRVEVEFEVTHANASTGDTSKKAPPFPRRGEVAALDSHGWKILRSRRPRATVLGIDALDVSLLQNRILAPILGISDPRTDSRIDFVGGSRGIPELERLVRERKFALAFAMHPTSLDELMAISDQNEIMPPKSTWFEPKLRDGLLVHRLGP